MEEEGREKGHGREYAQHIVMQHARAIKTN